MDVAMSFCRAMSLVEMYSRAARATRLRSIMMGPLRPMPADFLAFRPGPNSHNAMAPPGPTGNFQATIRTRPRGCR